MRNLLLKLRYFFARLGKNKGISGRVVNETKVDKPDESKPVVVIPDAPAKVGEKLMWYPKARIVKGMKAQGSYEHGHPIGAIVHYSASRDDNDQQAMDMFDWGKNEGYAYFTIAPSGQVIQSIPLNLWGSHCGVSSWPGLGTRLSNKLVGIEVVCAGKLDKNNKSWFGVTYDSSEVRNGFKKYTHAQELALFDLLRWLYENNSEAFNPDYILGHHEISPNRKDDPKDSLSIKMSELRAAVKANKNPFI